MHAELAVGQFVIAQEDTSEQGFHQGLSFSEVQKGVVFLTLKLIYCILYN
jgi:hypothetical protein